MSGVVWSKFFWSDWEGDAGLRLCSLGAQGLWMRMLCVAAQHDPIGYVCLSGRPLDVTDLARLAGVSETEAGALLAELDRNGVFSRDRAGRPYSRRLVRDGRALATARNNGKLGGNPLLGKPASHSNPSGIPRPVNPPHNPRDKGRLKAQSPESSTRVEGPKSPSNPGGAPRDGGRADGPPPPGPPASRTVGAIPAEVRAAVAGLEGEAFARAWLDPQGWRSGEGEGAAGGVIVCRLGVAAGRLEQALRGWLREQEITVEGPRPDPLVPAKAGIHAEDRG